MQSCDNSLIYIYIYINLFFSAVVLGFPAFGREAAWEMLSDLQAVVNIGILQLAGRLPSELGTPAVFTFCTNTIRNLCSFCLVFFASYLSLITYLFAVDISEIAFLEPFWIWINYS